MSYLGQTENIKAQLSAELISIEENRDNVPPLTTVRAAKILKARLQQTPRWDDSRSGISASFQTLWRDEQTQSYLKYTDISSRATALIAWGATHLTASQAEAEGVVGFHRLNRSAMEEHVSTTQRLSQPGGQAWEVARETPEPLVAEAVRRGGQAQEVGSKFVDKAAPVGQGLVDQLDQRNITNPLLGAVSLGLLVFMKNKLLAIVIIVTLVYLTKQRQISQVKSKVRDVQDRITGTVTKVAGAADSVQKTAERFN